MSYVSTDSRTPRTEITEKLAVKRRESAARKRELGRAVVRKERVRMLQECDENEPVINPIILKRDEWVIAK